MSEFTSLADMISQKPTAQPEPGKSDPRTIMFSSKKDALDWYNSIENKGYIHDLDRKLTQLEPGKIVDINKTINPGNYELFYRSLSLLLHICPVLHSSIAFNDDFTVIKKNI